MLHKWLQYLTSILCIYLIFLNIYLYNLSSEMKGDARVINYAGLVRGATQRLIKLELNMQPSDDLIQDLDIIIDGLYGKENYLNIPYMKDAQFQSNLKSLAAIWFDMKTEIMRYRSGKGTADSLLLSSERHFNRANETVFYAEIHSDKKVEKINQTKQLFYFTIVLFLLSLGYEIFQRIQLQQANKKLDFLAFTDKKTGLPNRTRCEQMIEYYNSGDLPQNLVCVMLDLNNLKEVNDQHGHETGDRLIRSFGMILGQVAVNYGFIGRNGGDEFLGLFTQCDLSHAAKFIADLDTRIVEFNGTGEVFRISYASGIAQSYVDDANSLQKMIRLADFNMYKKKQEMKEKE